MFVGCFKLDKSCLLEGGNEVQTGGRWSRWTWEGDDGEVFT